MKKLLSLPEKEFAKERTLGGNVLTYRGSFKHEQYKVSSFLLYCDGAWPLSCDKSLQNFQGVEVSNWLCYITAKQLAIFQIRYFESCCSDSLTIFLCCFFLELWFVYLLFNGRGSCKKTFHKKKRLLLLKAWQIVTKRNSRAKISFFLIFFQHSLGAKLGWRL